MAHNCKNFATCGNQTNEIPGKPGTYFDLCPACNKAKGTGTSKNPGAGDTKSPAIHAEHGKIELVAGATHYTVPILVIAKKNNAPLSGENVSVSYNAILYDIQPTDSAGLCSFDLKVIPATERGKQALMIFVGTQSKSLTVELPVKEKVSAPIIKATAIKKVGTDFEIKTEISTEKPNIAVRMKKGLTLISTENTDGSGEKVFTHLEPQTEGGKTIELRFISPDNLESTATIELPEVEKIKPESNDPQSLITYVGSDGAGQFRVFSRVLKENGQAVKNAQVRFQSGITVMQATTNDQGFAAWEFFNHRLLNPGDEASVDCFVDGIKDNTKVKLRRPPTPPNPPNHPNYKWYKDWWKWNNGRAQFGLIMTAILFILALNVGYGRPFFDSATNPVEASDELSYENIQKLNSKKTAPAIKTEVAKPEKKQAEWGDKAIEGTKKAVWFSMFFFLFCSTPYFILAYREEFGAAIREAFFAVLEKNYDRADDPLLEKLGRKLGTFSSCKNPPKVTVCEAATTTDPASTASQPQPAAKGNSFWELLRSDLLSDFLIELGPKILKRVIR